MTPCFKSLYCKFLNFITGEIFVIIFYTFQNTVNSLWAASYMDKVINMKKNINQAEFGLFYFLNHFKIQTAFLSWGR